MSERGLRTLSLRTYICPVITYMTILCWSTGWRPRAGGAIDLRASSTRVGSVDYDYDRLGLLAEATKFRCSSYQEARRDRAAASRVHRP